MAIKYDENGNMDLDAENRPLLEDGQRGTPIPKAGQRVLVTIPYAGLRAMQVCAVADATDEEILKVCNTENPQKVARGWHTVVRTKAQVKKEQIDSSALPCDCGECKGRKHIIALCM